MPSVKCLDCGLVNWDDSAICKRCGSNLAHLSQPKPSVWTWYVAYCAFMAVMYLVCLVLGLYVIVAEPSRPGTSAEEAMVMGYVFVIFGLLLSLPFAAGPFLPRKPWAWIFGLVLICVGLTSLCCLPAAIPLLLGWLKPETKSYFGRS